MRHEWPEDRTRRQEGSCSGPAGGGYGMIWDGMYGMVYMGCDVCGMYGM